MPESHEVSVALKPFPLVPEKLWYGAAEFVKKQSPDAWEKRIIAGMNKIIPKLSPQKQQWVSEHETQLESAAKVGGIAIATSELVLAEIVVQKGMRRLLHHVQGIRREAKQRRFEQKQARARTNAEAVFTRQFLDLPQVDPWYKSIYDAYTQIQPNNTAGFVGLAMALNTMVQWIFDDKDSKKPPKVRGALLRANGKSHAERLVKELFTDAYVSSQSQLAAIDGKSIHTGKLKSDAEATFGDWKHTNFRGLGSLVRQSGVSHEKTLGHFDALESGDKEKRESLPRTIYLPDAGDPNNYSHINPTITVLEEQPPTVHQLLKKKPQIYSHDRNFRKGRVPRVHNAIRHSQGKWK